MLFQRRQGLAVTSGDVFKVMLNQQILMLRMSYEDMHQDTFLSLCRGVCTLTATYWELRGV